MLSDRNQNYTRKKRNLKNKIPFYVMHSPIPDIKHDHVESGTFSKSTEQF